MTIAESRRFVLHRALRDQFGVSVADTLMEHLPPTGWGDVARRSDVALLKTDITRLEGEIHKIREVDFPALRTGVTNEVNVLVTEKMNSQLRWMIGLFSAQFIALFAIALR